MGTVEERTPHFWRKVRYTYMDARRHANAQGLTIKGPRRIYNAFFASAGMLFAQRHGLFRPYHDEVFRRFWSHELEIDELSQISGVIADIGGSAKDFEKYVSGPARQEHDRNCQRRHVAAGCGVAARIGNPGVARGKKGPRPVGAAVRRAFNGEGHGIALRGVTGGPEPNAAHDGVAHRRGDVEAAGQEIVVGVEAEILRVGIVAPYSIHAHPGLLSGWTVGRGANDYVQRERAESGVGVGVQPKLP